MRVRGYNVSEEKLQLSYQQFCAMYPETNFHSSLTQIFTSTNRKPLIVFFSEESKLSIKSLRLFMETKERKEAEILFVVAESFSPSVKALDDPSIELFEIKKLMYNILKHSYVPKNTLLTREQKKMLLDKLRLKEHQLPKILKTDPVAKIFGAKKGDVFMIERPSETVQISLYFRIVK